MPSYTTTMEDDRFGADEQAIACCRSFSLDFEGVLEEAEGALHLPICESLRSFAGEQVGEISEKLQHTVHEGCFSNSAPYQPFHFWSSDTPLQPDTATSPALELDPSLGPIPENSFHQILNYGSPIRNPAQSKQIPAGETLQQESMEASAPPPPQFWNIDQLQTDGQCDRASFPLQHHDALASHRSFVVYGGAPDGQTCIRSTFPGEFSSCASSSCSPVKIAANSVSFQPRLPQKLEDAHLSGPERRIGKRKRGPDQAGHVIRERLRRDDMTSKFLMLESLLPRGPKRDRATIVEHSIQHVKNLHHRRKDLQQKRTQMTKTTRRAPLPIGPRLAPKAMAPMHLLEMDQKLRRTTNDDKAKPTGGFFEKVEVHCNLPREIVVEMTCRPHAHLQSQVFGAVERLRMDVTRCSVSRARGFVLCSIVLQPREDFDPPVSSDDIVRALERVVIGNAGQRISCDQL